MRRGHWIVGLFGGILLGLALDALLVVFGALPVESILLVIIPIAGLVLGLLLGFTAPFGARSAAPPPVLTAPPPPPPPPPPAPSGA